MNGKLKTIGISLVIIGLGFIFQYEYLSEFPSHIHAWAQADRYALALGFVDNGLDFFHPQTFIFNHQFPHNWEVPAEGTVTAVDFPIHDYVPAVLMQVTGSTAPFLFRGYILLYGFTGLFFLYKLSLAATDDFYRSALVTVFAATSPVFVYYQAGFLPTIPSLANAAIGVYCYFRFVENGRNRNLWLCFLFLTLAALSRTTFAIPIVAVLGIEGIRLLRRETKVSAYLLPVSISAVSILAYYFYNGYLRQRYGSNFLNYLLPADDFAQAKAMVQYVYNTWFFQYFSGYHYLILAGSGVASAYFTLTRRITIDSAKIYLGLLSLLYFFGCGLFALLMLKQFPVHDYYFLDTFYLPTVLFLVFTLSLLPPASGGAYRAVSVVALAALLVVLVPRTLEAHTARRNFGGRNKTDVTIENFTGAAAFLDSLNIPRNARILVLDAVAPNIPFALMERKGYAVMTANRQNISAALTWDYDYVVLQNEYFFSSIYTPYPTILSQLERVADNGKISVFRYAPGQQQTLLAFLGFGDQPLYKRSASFEDPEDDAWQNANPNTDFAYTGAYSGHLTREMEYGLTFKTNPIPALKTGRKTLFFTSQFLARSPADVEVVVSITANGENLYYGSHNLKKLINPTGEWEKGTLMFRLPEIQADGYEFGIYLWNTGHSDLYYDDVEFSVY